MIMGRTIKLYLSEQKAEDVLSWLDQFTVHVPGNEDMYPDWSHAQIERMGDNIDNVAEQLRYILMNKR